MKERKCDVCGMPARDWKGNNGRGVSREGEIFCCEGCAFGGPCICATSKKGVPGGVKRVTLNENEDVDAYNADDKQPPFEEKAPRQRRKVSSS